MSAAAVTTAARATAGEPVGDARDVLLVVAQVRCARHGNQLGAVLHLDRAARGLAPVLLAEVSDVEAGRILSEATASGTPSTGARLADVDALVLDEIDGPVTLDCLRDAGRVHVLDAAVLRDAGRDGFTKAVRAHRSGRAARPVRIEVDARRVASGF